MSVEASAATGRGRDLALLLALGTFAFGWGMSARPLYNPDESRYAELAREMWEGGGWIVPRLDGVPYIDKPPLQVWLTAPLIGLLGPGEAAPRLVPFAAAMAVLAMLFAAGRRMHGGRAGFWAGVVWTTSALPLALARGVTLDMLLTALVTGSVLCFWRALDTRPSRPEPPSPAGFGAPRVAPTAWALAGWALAGLAFLTKGPLGFAIPAMAGAGWAVAHRRFPWRRLALGRGVALCLAIVVPWCTAAQLECPAFLGRFFLHENVAGFLSKGVHHAGPFYAPALCALGGLFPWTMLLAPAAVARREVWREPGTRFLLLWALAIVVFFMFSASKLIPYVLPAMPPLALAGGALIDRAAGGRGAAAAYAAAGTLGLAVAAVILFHPVVMVRGEAIVIPRSAALWAAVLGGGLTLGAWCVVRGEAKLAAGVAALAVAAGVVPAVRAVRSHNDVERSARALIARHRVRMSAGDVVQIGKADYSILYYLRRPVHFGITMPNELEFGHEIEPSPRLLRDDAAVDAVLARPGAVVVAWEGEGTFRPERYPRLAVIDRFGPYVLYGTR